MLSGSTTHCIATAAIAASAALPPARSTSSAVSVASGCEVAAIPFAAIAAERPGNIEIAHSRRSSLDLAQFARRSGNPDRRASRLLGTNARSYLAGQFAALERSIDNGRQLDTLAFSGRDRRRPGRDAGRLPPGVSGCGCRCPLRSTTSICGCSRTAPGWTIVDAGYATAKPRGLWERIFAERLGGRPVTRVIVTHYHPDHVGLAGWLMRALAGAVMDHREGMAPCPRDEPRREDFVPLRRDFAPPRRARRRRRASSSASARRATAAASPRYRRLSPDRGRNGDRDRRAANGGSSSAKAMLRSLPAFIAPRPACLIASDQVLPRISPNISVQAHEPDGDPLARYLRRSKSCARQLPPETLVLPSHNLPFFGLHARLDELAAHHHARCDEVLAACVVPKSAVDLLPVLFRRPLDQHQTAFRARRGARPLALFDRARTARPRNSAPMASTAFICPSG